MIIECKIKEECFSHLTDTFYEGTKFFTFRKIGENIMLKTPCGQIFYMNFDELKQVVDSMRPPNLILENT